MTTFKKKLKGLLSAWLVVAILAISVVPGVPMAASALSYEFCGENATYTLSDGVLTISGTGAIDANAFRGRSDITSVVIGEGITTIGNYAFYGCASLTTVTIPASVTAIGANAFASCYSLTTVTYKGTTEPSASSNAFYGTGVFVVNVPVGYTASTFAGKMAKKTIEITTQPQNKTANAGDTVTFTVAASGTGLTYQWNCTKGGSTTAIPGATSSTLTLTNVTASDAADYSCTISKGSDTLTSNAATLTVVAYGEYLIDTTTLSDIQTELSGIATVAQESGVTKITLNSDVKGRIRFDNNAGNFILDLNGKTIEAGTANEAICLDNNFTGTVTITGNGTLKKGVNNIIYTSFRSTLNFKVADGYDYFTVKKDGSNLFATEKNEGTVENISTYISGNTLVIANGTLSICLVSFNANGGSGTMVAMGVKEGRSYTLPANGFTAPANHNFAGWAL